MDETVRNSAQLAQIELAYAELELMQLGFHTSELRRSLEHIVSAKKHLREITGEIDWAAIAKTETNAKSGSTGLPLNDADTDANGTER